MSRIVRPGAVLVVVAIVAGCSSGPDLPAPEAFAPGVCRTIAEPVIAIGSSAWSVRHDNEPPAKAAVALREPQRRLINARDQATPPLRDAVQDLVTAIGFLRLHVDSHTYDTQQLTDVDAATSRLIARCTTPKPS